MQLGQGLRVGHMEDTVEKGVLQLPLLAVVSSGHPFSSPAAPQRLEIMVSLHPLGPSEGVPSPESD